MKKDNRNAVIVALLITVVFMSVGYALLSTKVDKTEMATSIISAYKDVNITTITSVETQGSAKDVKSFISGKTAVTVYPLVQEKGDKVIYSINVKNSGTQSSKLKSIDINTQQKDYIVYSLNNINAGDTIAANDSLMFTLIVEFNDKYTGEEIIQEANELTITLNYEK